MSTLISVSVLRCPLAFREARPSSQPSPKARDSGLAVKRQWRSVPSGLGMRRYPNRFCPERHAARPLRGPSHPTESSVLTGQEIGNKSWFFHLPRSTR
jgi:hypothetical protein